jgi:hypothetical protein
MDTRNHADHAARVSRIVDRLTLATDEADNSGRSYTKRRQAIARIRLEIEELRDLSRILTNDDVASGGADDLHRHPQPDRAAAADL